MSQKMETTSDSAELIEGRERLPNSCPFCASHAVQSPPEMIYSIPEPRKRRWEKLNAILDNRRVGISHAYSSPSWEIILKSFQCVTVINEPSQFLSDEVLEDLSVQLEKSMRILNFADGGKDAKLLYLIAPILINIANAFEDVELLVEEEINGDHIHADGRFEFLFKRGNRRIGIVLTKKEDFEEGKAHCLVGCESLCDVERLTETFGIVTNFIQWNFYKIEQQERITQQITSLSLERGMISKQSLRYITGMILTNLQS